MILRDTFVLSQVFRRRRTRFEGAAVVEELMVGDAPWACQASSFSACSTGMLGQG